MARTQEGFSVEDGKVFQVRHDNDRAFGAMMENRRHQAEAGVVRGEHRLRYSFRPTDQMEIIKKYGRQYDPARYGAMSEMEKRKFDQIVRAEFRHCIAGGFGQKYHAGGI